METFSSSNLVSDLRKFGRKGSEGDEAVDGVEKCGWGGQELDTDEIAVEAAERRRADVLDQRFCDRGLAIDHQLDRLNRLDRQRLLRFDQRARRAEVEQADRLADIKGTPEGSEDFEPESIATVGW